MKPEKDLPLWEDQERYLKSRLDTINYQVGDLESAIKSAHLKIRKLDIKRMLLERNLEFVKSNIKGLRINTLKEPIECPPTE